MTVVPLLLAGAVALGDTHSTVNPVFQQLVEKGVSPGGEEFFPLPAPLMPDGLDAAAQRKILDELGGPRRGFAELTRRSVVAPHVLRMETLQGPDPQLPLQSVDLFFVAYGDLNALSNEDFLNDVLKQNGAAGKGEGAALTPAELAERRIEILPANAENESYGRTTFELLDRVELSVVGRSFWSRTDHSIVTAAMVDPRFSGDVKHPNVWRSLNRNAAGVVQKGPPQPYRGAGVYMKITKLAAPQGALFIEAHIVFAEPHGWFDGANLLGAKIPVAAKEKVKDTRQEILRAQRAQKQAAGR